MNNHDIETPMNEKPAKAQIHSVRHKGRMRTVTVPEDPQPEEILADAIRENLGPHTVAAVVGLLQANTVADPETSAELDWLQAVLTESLGGAKAVNRLADEVGL